MYVLYYFFVSFPLFFTDQATIDMTVLAKKGLKVHLEMKVPGPYVRIEMTQPRHQKIKLPYDPHIWPDYNFTFIGSKGYFEISNFSSNKSGIYHFLFTIPVDHMYASHESMYVQIIEAEIDCGIKFPENVIVESSCQEVEKDKIEGWCSLNLYNDTKENFTLNWRTKIGNSVKNFGVMEEKDKNSSYIKTYKDDIPIEMYQGFGCYFGVLECYTTFAPKNMIYARNKSGRDFTSHHKSPMTPENKQDVNCSADTSSSVYCTYHWVYTRGHLKTVFPGFLLSEKDLQHDGVYECYASCAIKHHSTHECVLLSDRVEFYSTTTTHSVNVLTVDTTTLVFILIIAVSIPVCSCSCKFLYKRIIERRRTRENTNRIGEEL